MTALAHDGEAELRLIQLGAGTAAHRGAMRAGAEIGLAEIDWELLAGLLGGQRLLPTLGPRLLDLAGGAAPPTFAAAVTAALEAARRQDALLQLTTAMAIEALAGAGIRATALKGPDLGEALYGEAGRRLSSDVDLLVEADQLGEAVAVVRGMGYARPADHIGADGLPLLHFSLAHERGELPPIELHWRIHWYETRFSRERLLAPPGEGSQWRPAPVDELAALLLYYARDGFTGLRQATDLGAWWDVFGARLEPRQMVELRAAYPDLAPALTAALTVAERTVGFPAERLAAGGFGLGPRGRLAVRLARARPHNSQAQLFAEIGLIDGLLSPPRGLADFVRRQVAPPAEVIREHVEKADSGRITSTLGYSLRMLGRYALALARLLRPSAQPKDAVAS